jgi:hypothetical protein
MFESTSSNDLGESSCCLRACSVRLVARDDMGEYEYTYKAWRGCLYLVNTRCLLSLEEMSRRASWRVREQSDAQSHARQ